MGSTATMWVLNYSLCYVVYGCALTIEVINTFLPVLSLKEAGEVAFAGAVTDGEPNMISPPHRTSISDS